MSNAYCEGGKCSKIAVCLLCVFIGFTIGTLLFFIVPFFFHLLVGLLTIIVLAYFWFIAFFL